MASPFEFGLGAVCWVPFPLQLCLCLHVCLSPLHSKGTFNPGQQSQLPVDFELAYNYIDSRLETAKQPNSCITMVTTAMTPASL